MSLEQLDELLGRLPPEYFDDGTVDSEEREQSDVPSSVELSEKELNDLHILLREAAWNYFMGRREYYANKRKAIAAGLWHEDVVPGVTEAAALSTWQKKKRAFANRGASASQTEGSKRRGESPAETEWTDNPAIQRQASQDLEDRDSFENGS